MHTSWQSFHADATDLAVAVRARFEANLHHVLGTLRPSGAPRLSGTEVAFADGELSLGMMPDSRKLADVRRDPRVEIHCAPLDTELQAGDAKVSGRLVYTGDVDDQPGSAFVVDIERVSLVQVDRDELSITVWQPVGGVREIRRK